MLVYASATYGRTCHSIKTIEVVLSIERDTTKKKRNKKESSD